jgi:hypothetical protein
MQRTIQGFLDRLEEQQRHLREQLASLGTPASWLAESRIWKNYKLLQIFDRLSLYLCMPPWEQRSLRPAPAAGGEEVELILQPRGENRLVIRPYPFDVDPLNVAVESRAIPRKPYSGDEEFRAVLARAEVTELTFELSGST